MIIRKTYQLAIEHGEDLAEIGSHFYSRMLKKISKEEENVEKSDKHRVKKNDPSNEVFSEYLRRVYTFGCWQLLTNPSLKLSENESHARYLEAIPTKWSRI